MERYFNNSLICNNICSFVYVCMFTLFWCFAGVPTHNWGCEKLAFESIFMIPFYNWFSIQSEFQISHQVLQNTWGQGRLTVKIYENKLLSTMLGGCSIPYMWMCFAVALKYYSETRAYWHLNRSFVYKVLDCELQKCWCCLNDWVYHEVENERCLQRISIRRCQTRIVSVLCRVSSLVEGKRHVYMIPLLGWIKPANDLHSWFQIPLSELN